MAWSKKNGELGNLKDVAIDSPNNGYVLTYDSPSNKWVATQVSGVTPTSNEVTLQSITSLLENPFKKLRIKCLGDSITNGDGSTGFVSGGYNGWVKILNDWMTSKYNGDETVGLNSKYITITSQYTTEGFGTHTMPSACKIANPTNSGKGIEFNFYGDHFTIYYTAHNGGAIADVYIDGVKQGEIDTYSSTLTLKLAYDVTGLVNTNHSVEILETGRKNASASSVTSLIFESVKIPRTKTVFNAGNNGWASSGVYNNMKSAVDTRNITASDDIVLFMMGTNDRVSESSTSTTKWYQREIVKYAQSLGCKIILMSANPIPTAGENKNFKMHDVDMAVRQVALEMGVPFISNYDAFNQHINNTGVTLNSLLADGLHPNDTGYKVMANNIMKHLGLTVITDGISL